ncbi:MAG: tetratricopeptide repeat protein, partial [Cellvibrionales bacterium]|nr:tetratricopeptide repeat protein [Cellvibrionales bacterium]
ETINTQQYPLSAFAPNPDAQNNPYVDGAIISEFEGALQQIATKDYEAAKPVLENLHNNQPHLSGPAYQLGRLHYQKKEAEEAISWLQKALSRNPTNFDARNLLAYIHREKGEFDQAEMLWLENLTYWAGYAPSYKNLGILYDLYQGKPEKAIGFYKQYNLLQDKPDRLVAGWIVTIDRQLLAMQKGQQQTVETEQAMTETETPPESSETEVQ